MDSRIFIFSHIFVQIVPVHRPSLRFCHLTLCGAGAKPYCLVARSTSSTIPRAHNLTLAIDTERQCAKLLMSQLALTHSSGESEQGTKRGEERDHDDDDDEKDGEEEEECAVPAVHTKCSVLIPFLPHTTLVHFLPLILPCFMHTLICRHICLSTRIHAVHAERVGATERTCSCTNCSRENIYAVYHAINTLI